MKRIANIRFDGGSAMNWYRNLYFGKTAEKKKDRIVKQIETGEAFRRKMESSGQLCWAPQERGDYCDFDPSQM